MAARIGSPAAPGSRACDEDESPHWLGVIMDIGERKTLEAQFRQAQKMEAVGQLAGGVAHDFNNLLTSILGYSGFVIDSFSPQDERRADMDEVIKAGERAAGLTRQLLAFSRKQVLQPTRLDLNALVTGMHPMLSRLIGEQVELVPSLAAELSNVRADPGQLEQVLMNLVVNARDAMPSGGRLMIQTANVELDGSFMQDVESSPRSLCDAGGQRHRRRHDGSDKEPVIRTVLHDEGTRKGNGTRARNRLRHREAERRVRVGVQRSGQGHVVQGVFAARRRRRQGREPTFAG